MGTARILFLYDNASSFVLQDLSILRERFNVDVVECPEGCSSAQILSRLRRVDLSYSWFALGYATRAVLLGRILRRKSVVVAGGWDVLEMPEIGYGALGGGRSRLRASLALQFATLPLTFSSWSRETIRRLVRRDVEMIYLGVDVERFCPAASKEDLVVTVGNVTLENLARKGLATFVRAARQMPDVPFVLAGRQDSAGVATLRKMAPPNVRFPGWLPDDDLRDLLARAKVYVQVSYTEGFGLALAEAMASGAVPVVTRAGAIPEVAGEVGRYVPYGDVEGTAGAIREALVSDGGRAARERIVERFAIRLRRERLLAVIGNLLDGGRDDSSGTVATQFTHVP